MKAAEVRGVLNMINLLVIFWSFFLKSVFLSQVYVEDKWVIVCRKFQKIYLLAIPLYF